LGFGLPSSNSPHTAAINSCALSLLTYFVEPVSPSSTPVKGGVTGSVSPSSALRMDGENSERARWMQEITVRRTEAMATGACPARAMCPRFQLVILSRVSASSRCASILARANGYGRFDRPCRYGSPISMCPCPASRGELRRRRCELRSGNSETCGCESG